MKGLLTPNNRLTSQQEVDNLKKLAERGELEPLKKFLIEKQIIGLINLKNSFHTKTDVQIRDELRKIATYDIIIIDIDGLKPDNIKTEEIGGKAVKVSSKAEDNKKLINWLVNIYYKIFNKEE